jgi:peptide deformylase
MSAPDILKWPDPRLAQISSEVQEFTPELEALVDDLRQTMLGAGVKGLAAPQVGAMHRIIVLDVPWREGDPAPEVCINPVILETREDMITTIERSPGLPGTEAAVTRSAWIWMVWHRLEGNRQVRAFEGEEAAIVQQQVDQLDGLTFLDRIDPEMRTQLLADYNTS